MRILAHRGHRRPPLVVGAVSCAALALSLASAGCGRATPREPVATEGSGEPPRGGRSAEREPAMAPAEREARGALFAAVDAMVANCEIDQERCVVSRCANDEQRSFLAHYADGSRPRAALLPAWAELLSGGDGARATVAAYVVGGLMRSLSLDGSRPVVRRATAKALIAGLAELPNFHAARSAVGITHAAAIAGEFDALIATAKKHPHSEALLPIIYGAMLRYSRLAGFPTLQLAFDQADAPRVAAAIMAAPRALVDATPSERATLCGWVQPSLAEPRPSVANEAANTMVWCGGTFIDALLDHAASEIEAGTMNKNLTIPLRRICPAKRAQKAPGSAAQCGRNLELLEAAVLNDKLADGARVQALVSIHRQRPDDATLELAKKVKRQAGEHLRFRAASIVEALTSSTP